MYYIFTIIVVVILWACPAIAQLDAQFSQYMFNRIIYNPAYTGSENYINCTGSYRTQWMNMNGQPVTQSVSIDGPIEKLRSGIGGYFINDKIGPENTMHVMGTYSFRYMLPAGQIAIGFNGGIIQYSIDGSLFRAADGNYDGGIMHNDNLIPDSKVSGAVPDFGVGAYFTNSKFYAGFSTTHLTGPQLKITNNASYKLVRNFYLIGGYRYAYSNNIVFKPSFLIKSSINKTQLDLNTNVVFNKNIWIGISYRGLFTSSTDGFSALTGLNLTEKISAGYSYDITLSKLKGYSAGTHEFVLNYRIRPFGPQPTKLIFCPRFL